MNACLFTKENEYWTSLFYVHYLAYSIRLDPVCENETLKFHYV